MKPQNEGWNFKNENRPLKSGIETLIETLNEAKKEKPVKVKAKISIKQVSMKQLMKCHDLETVSGYCQSCSNFGKNHSCPEFKFSIDDYLNQYNYATVIMTHINTDIIKKESERLKEKTFRSRVFSNYTKNNPNVQTDWKSQLSMYVFNLVKDHMAQELLELEKGHESVVGLPPGSCTSCQVCTKTKGQACVHKDKLRYSLEALGFLVSDIYERFFDMQLGWTENELPESFNTCSAILSGEQIDIQTIENALGPIEVEL